MTGAVVIVGGGIAGLSTAYALVEQGYPGSSITVVEKDARWGGKIATHTADGFVFEGGPESLLAQKPWGIELCQKLGLESELMNTRSDSGGLYVWHKRRMYRVPEGVVLMVPTRALPFAMSPLISLWGKLRMALELFIPRKVLKETDDESLASFVTRRLGRECLERLAEPIMAGIYAGQADRLSLRCTFPRFLDMEQKYGSLIRGMLSNRGMPPGRWSPFVAPRRGMSAMVDGLMLQLQSAGVTLRPGQGVARIESDAGGYRLALSDGSVLPARALVLATPAFVTAELMRPLDLSIAEQLRGIPYGSSATVTLAYRKSAVTHPLDAFGFVVTRPSVRRVQACTWTSSKWSDRAPDTHVLLRVYVSDESALAADDDALIQVVRRELFVTMGIDVAPDRTYIARWDRGTPQYTVGHLQRIAALEQEVAQWPGLFLTGAAYRGVGIPDCIREGAEAARRVRDFCQSLAATG